jgi:hypothetical protein
MGTRVTGVFSLTTGFEQFELEIKYDIINIYYGSEEVIDRDMSLSIIPY